jgi:transposase-like protein
MSKSTISTFELFRMFPDQESARVYFEARRWPDGATCPACGEAKRIGVRKGGFYRCNACLLDFTIRTGTIFERSKVPLHKWLYAMYLLVTARKGISSLQLAKEIGITQKSAWFVLHRLREACGAVMKRGLSRYVDEFAFRLNDGNVKRHTMERLESFVSGTKGKRLTYKALIQ